MSVSVNAGKFYNQKPKTERNGFVKTKLKAMKIYDDSKKVKIYGDLKKVKIYDDLKKTKISTPTEVKIYKNLRRSV
ncbi:hypothetical protein U1Q18_031654 [Sarracenia purpurea var. burkii]